MKSVENIIKINCECENTLKLEEMTEFQGGLKIREDADFDKIVKSIKKFGFSFPFFVWKHDGINHLLDGHGRFGALKKLDSLGFLIPPLPVVYVNCKDERDARDLLLRLNSSYGKMTKDSVMEFIGDFEIDVNNFELASGKIDFNSESIDLDFDDDEDAQTFSVVVECEDISDQQLLYEQLTEQGYKCKVVSK